MTHHGRSPSAVPGRPRLLLPAEVARHAQDPVDAGVARVSVLQGGPVARWQLLLLGLTDDMVEQRFAVKRLWRPFRAVYVPGAMRWDAAGQSIGALLAVGSGWLTGPSACWWLELLRDPPPEPHVLRVGGTRRRRDGIVQHTAKRLDGADVTTVHGVPIVTPTRAMLDLAGAAPRAVLAEALATAEVRRMLQRSAVAAALPRWAGHHALKPLRAELGDLRPRPTKSQTERRFRALWEAVGSWPDYETNAWVLGKERDVVFRELRVVVELDGAEHFTESARQQDLLRDGALQAAGWDPVRFSGDRVRDDVVGVTAEMSAVLALAQRRLEDRALAAQARRR